jgi:hypothetical protein
MAADDDAEVVGGGRVGDDPDHRQRGVLCAEVLAAQDVRRDEVEER